jgi:uncharacterized protein YjdB
MHIIDISNIYWSSSNEAIATVDANGTVSSLSSGDCIIEAKVGKYIDSCVIKVLNNTSVSPSSDSNISVKITDNYLSISNLENEKINKVEIFNLHGKLIANETLTGNNYNIIINLTQRRSNIYMIRIHTEKNILTLKTIKY